MASFERPTGGVRERQGGDHRVAGARNVEHLARLGRHARVRPVRADQHHAALGAGAEQGRHASCAHGRAGGGGHLGFRAGRQARRARQLAGVGREAVHAPVEAEVVALGVGEDRDARFVGGGDRPGDHGRRQRALGVVRQDDRLAPRHPAPHRPDQRLGFPGVGRPRLLLVQPRHLLVAGDDAHLAGAAAGGTADRGVLDAGIAREQGAQFGRGVVFPEQRDQHRPPAEGDMLRATLPAPPGMAWLRRRRTTGTGASGEIRSTSPYRKRSSMASPRTRTRMPAKSSIGAVCPPPASAAKAREPGRGPGPEPADNCRVEGGHARQDGGHDQEEEQRRERRPDHEPGHGEGPPRDPDARVPEGGKAPSPTEGQGSPKGSASKADAEGAVAGDDTSSATVGKREKEQAEAANAGKRQSGHPEHGS
jgi:hypothetical protein